MTSRPRSMPSRTFHDAVVLAFEVDQEQARLALECVTLEAGEQETGVLLVSGLTRLTEDGRPVGAPTFEWDDGQILELTIDGGSVALVVEWEHYREQQTVVAAYQIDGDYVSWQPGDHDPTP